MNILITGDLASLSVALARKFSHEKHKVVLAGPNPTILTTNLDRVVFHTINIDEVLFQEVLAAYKFDVAIYIAAREERLPGQISLDSGKMLGGLLNMLDLCKNEKVQKFFLISSTEIYGDAADTDENSKPRPVSFNGYTLQTAEQYCHLFRELYNVQVAIIRVPHVYGPDENNSLMSRIIQDCRSQDEVILPVAAETEISLLHEADVADFVSLASEESSNSQVEVINLSSADPITFSDLAEMMSEFFPAAVFKFDGIKKIYTRPAKARKAKKLMGWVAKRTLRTELANVVKSVSTDTLPKKSAWRAFWQKISAYETAVKWVELILGAVAVQYLNALTGTLMQFKYVDFRLLFVVLMGSMHGTQFGLLASILASASALLSWYQMGLDWVLLIYNIENWLPFALYFTAGAITGYLHDRKENEIRFQNQQANLIHEKYRFLYGIYNEIRGLKDQFREQLMGYRDSFGRIFNITTELDTLQEEDVHFRALSILEDVMSNQNIAIYSIDPNLNYARLKVNSRLLNDSIRKSLKISDYPEIIKSIQNKTIFQNTTLQPDCPAYFAPIYNNNSIVAGVMIWSVTFEQYSLYYYNLFKVITGLIQSSLVRATLFKDANFARVYIPNTKVLQPEAFDQVLTVKQQMRDNQIADYQLLRVVRKIEDWEETYNTISKGIRGADYVGKQENGECVILLSQTDNVNADHVLKRLLSMGIECALVQ